MAVTVSLLASRTGANATTKADALTSALAVAEALVSDALEDTWRVVPDAVRDEAVLRTAISVYRGAGGSEQETALGADGSVIPGTANDPLRKAMPLIKRYINRV